jgi:hypothetical protein
VNDKIVAATQIGLALVFILGYFAVVYAFMFGYVLVPTEYKEAFVALLGVITASVVQIISYFFARQRNGGSGESN